jgi:hypothetical protein
MRPQYPLDPKALFATAFSKAAGQTHWDKLSRARGKEGFPRSKSIG